CKLLPGKNEKEVEIAISTGKIQIRYHRKIVYPLKNFSYGQDQDMRIRNSNGDIDMRTLPPTLTALPQSSVPISTTMPSENTGELDVEQYKRQARILTTPLQDSDIMLKSPVVYRYQRRGYKTAFIGA
ncbi:hypothetical protein NQ317_000578, partial [Molorchus minor]